MRHQKNKKKIENYLNKSNQKFKYPEYKTYDPDSPLTRHYITTGAVLPEKKKTT